MWRTWNVWRFVIWLILSGKAVSRLSYSYSINYNHAINIQLHNVHWVPGGSSAAQCSRAGMSVGFYTPIDQSQSCSRHLLDVHWASGGSWADRYFLARLPDDFHTAIQSVTSIRWTLTYFDVHVAPGGSLVDWYFLAGLLIGCFQAID